MRLGSPKERGTGLHALEFAREWNLARISDEVRTHSVAAFGELSCGFWQ